MNFAEPAAWKLLLGTLGCLLLVRLPVKRLFPRRIATYDRGSLAVLSGTLLWAVDSVTFGIFFAVVFVTYAGLRATGGLPLLQRRRCLWVLVPLQLAPLLFFKYSDFLFNGIARGDFDMLSDLVIPAGISFYSFQLVSFAIDTLVRGRPLPRFLDFLNFAGFFPQIVAGPIERRAELLPQIERFRFSWDAERIDGGVRWIVIGLFFKSCLADNLALYFDPDSCSNAYFIWLANVVFGLRIYLDFAGYSYIALGLARCFGVELTLNFASPYCARNVGEFWRRWHITLSQWFRDYVYLPMGGNRVARWWLNIVVVFAVSGVWHGAGWNFVLWGLLHGIYLIGLRSLPLKRMPAAVSWFCTMAAVFFSWLFFYETNTSILWNKVSVLLNPSAYALPELRRFMFFLKGPDAFVMACFLVICGILIVGEMVSLRFKRQPLYHHTRMPSLVVMVVLIVWLSPGTRNSFIYFSF